MKKREGFVSNSSSSSYVAPSIGDRLTQKSYRDVAINSSSEIRIQAIRHISSLDFLKKLKENEPSDSIKAAIDQRIEQFPNSVKFIGEEE